MGEIKLNMSNLVTNNLLYHHKTKTYRSNKNKTIKRKKINGSKSQHTHTHTKQRFSTLSTLLICKTNKYNVE